MSFIRSQTSADTTEAEGLEGGEEVEPKGGEKAPFKGIRMSGPVWTVESWCGAEEGRDERWPLWLLRIVAEFWLTFNPILAPFVRLTDGVRWGGAVELGAEGTEVVVGLNSAGTVEREKGIGVCLGVDCWDGTGEGVAFKVVGVVKGRWGGFGGRGG